MEIITEKHSSVALSSAVNEICQPLFKKLDLNFFALVRIYNDGSRIVLTNAGKLQHHYCEQSYYTKDSFALLPEHYIDGNYSASLFKNSDINIDASTNFSIEYLMTIVDKHLSYCDIFHIGKDPYSLKMNYQSCFDELDTLYSFKEYFKEQSKELIKASDVFSFNNKIIEASSPYSTGRDEMEIKDSDPFPFKRYNFDSKMGAVYFTPREIQCLRWLIRGKSAAEIGLILSTPTRTVEKHITNMKNKLHCRKLGELIYQVINSPLLKLLLIEL